MSFFFLNSRDVLGVSWVHPRDTYVYVVITTGMGKGFTVFFF